MTQKYRTKGFVFKKDQKSEVDQSFSVFTEDYGRLELRARAIRKITSKLRADLDIFYFSEIEFIQGKNYKTLTDALKIAKPINSLGNLEIACQISNVLDGFIRGQEKDKETFDFLNDFFSKLADNKNKVKNYQLAFQYFFWNFISLQGYKLEAENCANCRGALNPNEVYFSAKDGGVVCKKCQALDVKSKKINSDVVKLLRMILEKNWNLLSKLRVEPVSQDLLSAVLECAQINFCPS
jgi:DNA repair protein RecO (recombination protein O)